MLTEYEARKLQAETRRQAEATAKQRLLRDMRNEPAWRLGVVLKFAACLLILAGLALIGARTDLHSEASFGAPAGSAQDRAPGSIVEATQAYDEVVESERRPPLVSERPEKEGEHRSTVKAEHHRKAVFDERRRTWELQKDGENRTVAGRKDEP